MKKQLDGDRVSELISLMTLVAKTRLEKGVSFEAVVSDVIEDAIIQTENELLSSEKELRESINEPRYPAAYAFELYDGATGKLESKWYEEQTPWTPSNCPHFSTRDGELCRIDGVDGDVCIMAVAELFK